MASAAYKMSGFGNRVTADHGGAGKSHGKGPAAGWIPGGLFPGAPRGLRMV